jgi:hypothetical protein
VQRLAITDLPTDPLAAAAVFHGQWLPRVIAAMAEARDDLALILPPADHTHRAWRLAAVQSLARRAAPRRVNAIASTDEAAIAAAEAYLAAAPGVTGQVLALDSHGAGGVLPSAA